MRELRAIGKVQLRDFLYELSIAVYTALIVAIAGGVGVITFVGVISFFYLIVGG